METQESIELATLESIAWLIELLGCILPAEAQATTAGYCRDAADVR
ncbi:TPA: hypothetical protein QDB50_003913 [Burkholderia vietnamiensis]|nr:hypothetical protein [Burkholderia vietnamiensis]